MIRFPETAESEWTIVAEAANAHRVVKRRIERGTQIEREVERLHIRHEAKAKFQAELDAEDTPPLVLGTITQFAQSGQNTPVDLIEGVMKEDGICMVIGPGGAGKTTASLQMIHSLLTGDLFLGQAVKQINGTVGILSYDQNSALMTNWITASGLDTDRVSMVDAHGRGNPLSVPSMRRQIADTWRGMGVEVVLVDSFSASFHGLDQNDTALTMAYYRDMKKFVLTEVGAKSIIMIVHSTPVAPLKPRGSTAHVDVTDTMVAVTLTDPADKTSARRVSIEKYRAGLNQEQMEPVIVTAPDSVTHLVDLDLGAMTLAGLKLPISALGTHAFPAMPDAHEAPETETETETDSDEEDDDL